MTRFLCLTPLLLSLGAAAGAETNDTPADTSAAETALTPEAVDLDVAETIYQRNCRACHGNKAQGVASYPKLSDKEPAYIAEKLEIYRSGERIGPNSVLMIQNARDLSDDEIAALSVYVTTAFD